MATIPSFPDQGSFLPNDDKQIERMEKSLRDLAVAAFDDAGVSAAVHGVFSLDDFETKLANSLASHTIGVGASYSGCERLGMSDNPKEAAVPGSGSVKQLGYNFLIILAVPSGGMCEERLTATQLLTVLRRRIHGAAISGDIGSRTWNFQKEAPMVAQSAANMIFYTQVWQVTMPLRSA